jgi:ferritin
VDEQAEEEQKFQSILDKFELLGEGGRALYSIDKLMGRMAAEE